METEEKQLNLYACNHINDKDVIGNLEMLEHIASCDICATSYAKMIETNSMIKAPHYMKANILQKSRDIAENQKLSLLIKYQYTKRLQLFRYSMKVALAMSGALAMLFLSSFGNFPNNITQDKVSSGTIKENDVGDSFASKMNNGFKKFSNNVVEYADTLVSNNKYDMEENKNEDEKK